MKYVSAKEIAKRWGVSLRSVQYYCSNGKIPGAHNLGKQWLIPADAVHPSDARAKSPVPNTESYIFPLFVYSPAYTYSDDLHLDEHALFTAQLKVLEGNIIDSVRICRKLLSLDVATHVLIGVYYTLAFCDMVLGNHSEYKKSVTELEANISSDDPHYNDYLLLLDTSKHSIDWNHSIYDNIDVTKLSSDALYFYQCVNLFNAAVSVHNISEHSLRMFDALALQISLEGIEPLYVQFLLLLASLHLRFSDHLAEECVETACRIAISNNWNNLLSRSFPVDKILVEKVLKKTSLNYCKKIADEASHDYNNWRMVKSMEQGLYPFESFSQSEAVILFMIFQGLSNNEICTLMDLSMKDLQSTLQACYKTANVKNRNELKKYTINEISKWSKS